MTPRAWWLFALSSGVWGVPYLFIRVAVDAGVPPAFIAWARVALAAALLLPFALRRGALRGLRGRSGAIAAYAACEIAVPFVLIAMGERYISSSLTAILIATMPLFVALLWSMLSGHHAVRCALAGAAVALLLAPFTPPGIPLAGAAIVGLWLAR